MLLKKSISMVLLKITAQQRRGKSRLKVNEAFLSNLRNQVLAYNRTIEFTLVNEKILFA